MCIGTSGPAGTDMITGLYSASADSIPILCITGQAPRARLYKEDFQAVDIESIAKPVTKWAVTVREPALVPRVFQQAFHIMRSGRPGPVLIDLPFDVQMAEIEFDIDTYEPLPAYKPAATRAQAEKAMAMLNAAERPLIVSGGGVINADAAARLQEFAETHRRAGDPDPDGLGHDPRRPPADGRHGRPADLAPLWQRHHAGVGLRVRHRQPLGQPPHRLGRGLHRRAASSCMWTSSRRRSAACSAPDYGIVSDAGAALDRLLEVAREMEGRRHAARPQRLGGRVPGAQAHDCSARRTSTTCR